MPKKSTKRIEKKRTRQQQRTKLEQSGISSKEVTKLQGHQLEKAVSKVDQQQQYQANREYLLGLGIDKTIISQKRLYRRKDKFLQDKENIKKWRKESRELNRYRKLIDAGYKKEEIKKAWLRYDKITNRMILERKQYDIVYFNKYLLLLYADVMGDSNIDPDQFIKDDFYTLKEDIKNRVKEAELFPDDSDTFHGAFKMISGTDKTALKITARKWERRGYDIRIGKFSKNSYDTVTIKNDWTPREFAEMILLVYNHSSNMDTLAHHEFLKKFVIGCGNSLIESLFD